MNKEEEIKKLWKFVTHIESILRANKLWVVKDDKGPRRLGEVLDPELDASDSNK